MPFWAITPEVRSILTLYNRCSERNALPCPGGILDQPEAIMSDFDVIDEVVTEHKRRRAEEQRAQAELKTHG